MIMQMVYTGKGLHTYINGEFSDLPIVEVSASLSWRGVQAVLHDVLNSVDCPVVIWFQENPLEFSRLPDAAFGVFERLDSKEISFKNAVNELQLL